MSNRQLIARTEPVALEALATSLHGAVEDIAAVMRRVFVGFRRGDAGPSVAWITEQLFTRWCAESQTIPMPRLVKEIGDKFKTKSATVEELKKLFLERYFPQDAGAEVADALVAYFAQKKPTPDQISKIVWRLYDSATTKLCVQTAHVLVGRILLYRIGEDSNAFPERLSGTALSNAIASAATGGTANPALLLVDQMRADREGFLPTLYRLGEFDWWYIPSDKRSALSSECRANVSVLDNDLDLSLHRTLGVLDRYQFAEVDVDVWRNVYQHYLPREERQRLGGFYTPEELVELVLDLVGYSATDKNLGRKLFIDPACGSGAFVVGALARLLKHFEKHDPPGLPPGKIPSWTRAECELRAVQTCLHGIDLHPFASFLTNLNVLFLLLPKYMEVKKRNPSFTLEPSVVAHDSLLTTAAEAEMNLLTQTQVNGRVERSAEDHKQYVALLGKEFDFVFGNPPWSGILKGPLAAVYDEQQKSRLKETFKYYATGKYDVYGLFIARSLRLLRNGGVFGLVTQDTYFEKEWAKGLRYQLATTASLRYLVSLNPFGQLLFGAMNTPAITVADKTEPVDDHEIGIIFANSPTEFHNLDQTERRKLLMRLVTAVANELKRSTEVEREFVRGYFLKQAVLRESARRRWNLAPNQKSGRRETRPNWTAISSLFEIRQGVTPGGKGCLDIYLMKEQQASQLALEANVIHDVVKGKEVEPYKCRKTGKVILYPYTINEHGGTPAFDLVSWKAVQKGTIPPGLRVLPDALEMDLDADSQEQQWRKGHTLDSSLIAKILQHRQALGIISFPNAAGYLLSHYSQLERRVLKKKNIRRFNRRWYEYAWPRDPDIMLARPKIISPRLTHKVRFALDSNGIVPQDSCIVLVKTGEKKMAWDNFVRPLDTLLGRNITEVEVIKITLAFLNSANAQRLLTTGRNRTPKGSYQITEDYLADIQIPPLTNATRIEELLAAVDVLRTKTGDHSTAQAQIDSIVASLIK